MTRASLALITCLLAIGCDPQDQAAAGKNPTAPAGTATAGKDSAGQAAPAGPSTPPVAADGKFDGLSSCLLSCEAADKIPTNRATCKLNCDASYGAQAGEASAKNSDLVDTAVSCLGRCYSGEASPEVCATACKSTAAAGQNAPAAAVLDTLSTCVQTCHADKKALPTNRATCELNCAQAARVAGPAAPAAP